LKASFQGQRFFGVARSEGEYGEILSGGECLCVMPLASYESFLGEIYIYIYIYINQIK
jgi:hypothetical protein